MNALSERTRLGLVILGASAALGVAADLLLRAMPWGLNALVCVAVLIAAVWWLAAGRPNHGNADVPWLGVAGLILASTFAVRDSHALRALDLIGIAIVVSLTHLSLRGVPLRGRHAWEYARGAVMSGWTACTGVLPLLGRDVSWDELPSVGGLRHAGRAALGVLLAFPLLLVFGALFASADVVFRNSVHDLLDIDFATLISHTFVIASLATLAAGYLRGVLLAPASEPGAGEGRPLSIGIVPVATALALVDLLFLAFVVIQMRYFFGGTDLVQRTTGLTYAEYARRGFLELVAASALVLPILIAADWAVQHEPRAQQRWFGRLAAILLVLLGVVMASAFERMRLYVAAFGLSEVRLYATAFMAYLAGVFAWLAWTTLRGRRGRFAFGALVQGFAVLAGLQLLNPDAFIVRVNLARPAAERPFDGRYAASLGTDAVPDLLDALPRLEAREQCRAARGLMARWHELEHDDWRNWNLSRVRARRLLRDNMGRLQGLACSNVST